MILPDKGQTFWHRAIPSLDLLPNFLFWLSKETCSAVAQHHIVPTRGPPVSFGNLILDRPTFNQNMIRAISSYGTGDGYHRITYRDEAGPADLEWLIYHAGAGREWESIGLIPAIARGSAPGHIPITVPILSLNVAIETVWAMLQPTLQRT